MKSALVMAAALVLASAVTGAAAPVADTTADCGGGIAPNPSVEEALNPGGPPSGYTFVPAAPVPPGTPAGKAPSLATVPSYPADGGASAVIQTPDTLLSTAYEAVRFVPGGTYLLTDWTGTHAETLASRGNDPSTGLRFYDDSGKKVLENKVKVTHDVTADQRLARQDFSPSVAPANAASVKFFAGTNYNYVRWDCVQLRVAAYSVRNEVQDPATGAWGPRATVIAGSSAHYRVTVTNEGTEPLSNLAVDEPWCAVKPAPIDAIPGGESRQAGCDHPAVTLADDGHATTATVSGVTYPGGKLADQTATATVRVKAIGKIGDLVWTDTDRNGRPDPGEPGVPGVKVTLKDGAGKPFGEPKTTDAQGKYLFDKLPDGDYRVCFDLAGLPAPVAGYSPTKGLGDPATGCTPMTTLGPDNRENLGLDLGLVPPPNRLGDFVWSDTNRNGLQDPGEPGVPGVRLSADGVTVVSGPDGKYLFGDLADGTYTLCVDLSSLPPGTKLTKKDAGDDTKDSDVDPATGCTQPITLGAGKREDLTWDVGIIPLSRITG